MITTSAIIIAVFIAATLVYAATRPHAFRIERSIVINAPPDPIFPQINDLHQWEAWCPWDKIDPAMKRSYSGATNGNGAIYRWQGNKAVGQGPMEIVESTPSSGLLIEVEFMEPFEGHNMVQFTLVPQGDATKVTQTMYGPSPFMAKLMGLFFSMDKMVGQKYEQGRASLKSIIEK